jgi:YVTN family beta-propeller protein
MPGTNLLVNGGAEAGARSQQGWDNVTIPGWRVPRGLPTVVAYGTKGFPGKGAARDRGKQLFAGGAGGTAELIQQVSVHDASGKAAPAGARFTVSAALGGTKTSSAYVAVRFFSKAGKLLGSRRIGPVGKSGSTKHPAHIVFARRASAGRVPRGAWSAKVALMLSTTLKNADGYYAPIAGYDRAVADNLRLSVSFPVLKTSVLAPPASKVPGYDHVFLFYFENEDYSKIIGNTRQAPFLNSLRPKSSVLGNFFAEEHPSDANYLALAGGSAFGIPLTDPLEINPRYTIDARNIGDLVNTAHKSWKGYLQNANGPCDDTVHDKYWDDDLPLLYFKDIRDRPAYCAAHVQPLESMTSDLKHAATTPNLAWVGPDDCSDMEGCGIRAGDTFLKQNLTAIMRSPAWTKQRSLAIITFDEDGYDHEHPAQKVATLVLGSQGVRRGYVSHARYTHYSLLKTIEGALGLGTLTANDRYADPVNDVFTASKARTLAAPVSTTAARAAAPARQPAVASQAAVPVTGAAKRGPTAFIVNEGSGTVTPINMTTCKAAKPIKVGSSPEAIRVTPNGRTAYVANAGSGTVTPITTATRRAGTPIPVGKDPRALTITPDGRTVYVANSASGTVTPIATATGVAGRPIRVGANPRAITVTPDGRTVYVLNWGGGSVTPISTRTNRAGRPIRTGSFPFAIAIHGGTAYVVNYGSNTVTPISTRTNRAGRPIRVGQAPDAIAITPNGKTAYVVNGDTDTVTPITTATGVAGRPIRVGYSPAAVTISGSTAYVVNTISGTLTPISTVTGRTRKPINVGTYGYPLVLTPSRAGSAAEVLDTYSGQVTPVHLAAGHAFPKIKVGAEPVAVAIAG